MTRQIVPFYPADVIRIAERSMANLQWEIVPKAHHITALAQPGIVNERMERFFSEDAAQPAHDAATLAAVD